MNPTKTLLTLTILFHFVTSAYAIRELPAYLPSAPAASKAVEDYTATDVMGVVCTTQEKLPVGHPFAGKKPKEDLRTEWPGATTATNIDQFLNYLLLTPNRQDERVVRSNVYWILVKVMNVSDAEKSAAILRVYAAQTEAAKKRKIAMFAEYSFSYLMDVNLLALVRDLLDDDSALWISKPEGLPPAKFTVRRKARLMCRNVILRENDLNIKPNPIEDFNHIYEDSISEEQSCQRMKQWMIDNWALITTKAAEAKANPNRPKGNVWLTVFDPRP